MVFDIPAADDPAIQTAEIQAVDAVTNEPLRDAVFEFEDPRLAPLRADPEGRMRLGPVDELNGVRGTGLYRWLVVTGTLHAPGHLSYVPHMGLWSIGPEPLVGVDMNDVEAWRKDPV